MLLVVFLTLGLRKKGGLGKESVELKKNDGRKRDKKERTGGGKKSSTQFSLGGNNVRPVARFSPPLQGISEGKMNEKG